jgi:hypothetical protein
MFKMLLLVIAWTLSVQAGVLYLSSTHVQVDPSDDFSFALSSAPGSKYRIMNESVIVKIFEDKLGSKILGSSKHELARLLIDLCDRYRFDPAFVLSLIYVESSFKSFAVSDAGAVGLMQLMPTTAMLVAPKLGIMMDNEEMAEKILKDPFKNLQIGMAYLAQLRDRYSGFAPHYVTAYNTGPGWVDRWLLGSKTRPKAYMRYHSNIRKFLPEFRSYGFNDTKPTRT